MYKRQQRGLAEFSEFLSELAEERLDVAQPLVDRILKTLRSTEWLDSFDERSENGHREEALEKLLGLAAEHDERHAGSGAAGFLARLVLDTAPHEDPGPPGDRKAVQLSTLHGAKGAEFDFVVIAGVCDDVIPHGRALSERPQAGLSEERRLFYVGLTRARHQIILTWSRRRRFASQGWAPARASRFFDDLPPDLVLRVPVEMIDALKPEVGPATCGLRLGDRVEHPHWGRGRLVLFTSRDADARAIVAFDRFGPRELFLRHTTLRRVEG